MSDERIIHIIDDDADFRQSLVLLLEAAGYTTAAYGSGAAFLAVAPSLLGGCVLLDVYMPKIDGFDVLARLVAGGATLPIIVMTAHGDIAMAVRAIKAGAADFIEKPFDDEPLLEKLEEAIGRPARIHEQLDSSNAAKRIALLSPREREVLSGLLAGRPNKVIAYDLGLSIRTVELHRARMLERLGVHSLGEAIRLAVLAGLHAP